MAVNHRFSPALGAALLIALGLSLPGLRAGLWVDEWATIHFTSGTFAHLLDAIAVEPPPPGFYFLTWLWFRIVPAGEATVRVISVVAHLGTVALVYRYAMRFHGPRTAAVAAVAIAANPIALWFATNGRCYALINLVAVYTLHAYREERWNRFAVACAALGWLHYTALLLPVLIWIREVARTRDPLGPVTRAGAIAFALFSPLVVHLIRTSSACSGTYEWFRFERGLACTKWWFGLDALSPVAVLVVAGLLFSLVLESRRVIALELWLVLGAQVFLAAFSAWVFPFHHPKIVLWTLPLACVAIARALDRPALTVPALVWLAIVVAGGVSASGLEKSGDRNAARWLAERIGPADQVLVTPRLDYAVRWYLGRLPRSRPGAPRPVWVRMRQDSGLFETSAPDRTFGVLESAGPTWPTTWPVPKGEVLK